MYKISRQVAKRYRRKINKKGIFDENGKFTAEITELK